MRGVFVRKRRMGRPGFILFKGATIPLVG